MTKRYPMEILRKLAACAFAFALAATLVPAAAFASPAQAQSQEEATIEPVDPAPEGPIAEGTLGQCTWTVRADGELVIAPGEAGGSLGSIYDAPPWQAYAASIKTVFIEPGVSASMVLHNMFANCASLTTAIILGLDTSNTVDMSGMFEGCTSLTTADISGLDTSSVQDMSAMFAGCSSLKWLYLSRTNAINTSNVTTMSRMFEGCSSLRQIDLAGIDTTKVTDMSNMFAGCSALGSIDISMLKTENVTTMEGMFSRCGSLAAISLNGLDTANVKSMRAMFAGCSALAEAVFTGVNAGAIVDMGQMFDGCSSLSNLDLATFNTPNLTNADRMLSGCTALETLDLSGLNTAKTTNMGSFFGGCEALTEVKLGADFVFHGETSWLPVGSWGSKVANDGGEEVTSFTARQIATEHVKIADTYTREMMLTNAELSDTSFVYDGTEKVPTVVVTSGDRTLVEGTDYAVTPPSDSKNVGEKSLDITGIGAYSGGWSGENAPTYAITAAPVTEIILDTAELTYDGTERLPGITVKAGELVLDPKTDYDVTILPDSIGIGDKTVSITAKGNFTGERETSYKIVPATITAIELSATEFVYDGKEKSPSVTVKCGDKVLTAGTDYEVTMPSDRVTIGKKTVKVTAKGNYKGMLEADYEIVETPKPDKPDTPAPADSQTMFRLYNPNSGEHFFTADADERDNLASLGWKYEGNGWTAPTKGDPVYRLYNPNAGEHHYTLDASERDMLVNAGWKYEGIGWYSDPNKKVPLYRVYNPNEFANNHHYTADNFERGYLIALGWRDESIAWYGIS